MTDRAAIINMAVNEGITDLSSIRNIYNRYAEGGNLDTGKEQSIGTWDEPIELEGIDVTAKKLNWLEKRWNDIKRAFRNVSKVGNF